MTPDPITGGVLPVPQPPSTAADAPPAASSRASTTAPRPAVSVSLTSVDPPMVAEYAELTPGSTGPLVTALTESTLMSELEAHRAFSAQAAAAADGAGAARRVRAYA